MAKRLGIGMSSSILQRYRQDYTCFHFIEEYLLVINEDKRF